MTGLRNITVKGAREHNLKGVDVELPRDKLVVITGLSGSGKSSLAFDTIYAEGQRRYVESLSAYARQFLQMMEKPDVDYIEGLSPAISIEQKTTSRNPRSTVGTVTEIYDYMRLLFARVGIPYSPATGLPIESQTVSQMVDRVLTLDEGTRLYLLAPMIRGRKGEYRKEFADLLKRGFQRVKVDGEFYELDSVPALDKKKKHDIEVVVDRLVVRPDIASRLADSMETALRLADGIAIAEFADEKDDDGNPRQMIFSEKFACPVSGFTIEEIEPRLFSFNNPFGACPSCDGLGTELQFEADLVVPDPSLTPQSDARLVIRRLHRDQHFRHQVGCLLGLVDDALEHRVDFRVRHAHAGAEAVLHQLVPGKLRIDLVAQRIDVHIHRPQEGFDLRHRHAVALAQPLDRLVHLLFIDLDIVFRRFLYLQPLIHQRTQDLRPDALEILGRRRHTGGGNHQTQPLLQVIGRDHAVIHHRGDALNHLRCGRHGGEGRCRCQHQPAGHGAGTHKSAGLPVRVGNLLHGHRQQFQGIVQQAVT